MNDPGIRGNDLEVFEAVLTPPQEGVSLSIAAKFEIGVDLNGLWRSELVHLNRMIDDQLDRLQRVDPRGIAPIRAIASRMAARSTTAGTPVKSCRSTRLGVKAISVSGSARASHRASERMSSARTARPSSVRRRFSRRMRSEKGSFPVGRPALSRASRRKMSYSRPPARSTARLPKLSFIGEP